MPPGMQKNKVFWHQSEARTAATVWNWSGKTLSPGALLAVLYFSFVPYFSARLDFPSLPLSAPGSPRMVLLLRLMEVLLFDADISDIFASLYTVNDRAGAVTGNSAAAAGARWCGFCFWC